MKNVHINASVLCVYETVSHKDKCFVCVVMKQYQIRCTSFAEACMFRNMTTESLVVVEQLLPLATEYTNIFCMAQEHHYIIISCISNTSESTNPTTNGCQNKNI